MIPFREWRFLAAFQNVSPSKDLLSTFHVLSQSESNLISPKNEEKTENQGMTRRLYNLTKWLQNPVNIEYTRSLHR